nr:uncharacterized protein LOC108118663 [Drosophila bipectinata]
MGKDPSAVVLVTALVFCAFCPFFARCDEIELDIKKGIASLSNVLVKYQADFDRKVKFVELQEAIDEIGKAMLEYNGTAKDTLPQIRSLNSEAHLTYQNCVGPVFEWCISVNSTFNIFIDNIGDSNLSERNRNIILNLVAVALELGLEKTGKSLELLTSVQFRTAQLKQAFKVILHDVHYDFGPGGFYGEERAKLQKAMEGFTVLHKIFNLNQKQTYKEQIELIERFFTFLTQKIEKATEIVEERESNLEEDKSNLYRLQKHFKGANDKKLLLLFVEAHMRRKFIQDIINLKNSCDEYVNWHGFDAPFYQKISSRTRRAASTFYESESSPA